MSYTESVRDCCSVEEAEVEDMEEEEEILLNSEATHTMMKNGGQTLVTVVTRNVKEVSWPPTEFQDKEKEVINSIKTLPNLSGVVHLGRATRKKMDLELQNFKGSTAHYSSHPFIKGGYQPNKMKAAERWNPMRSIPMASTQAERPKLVLRNADTVLTQGSVGGHSTYKIPPGTTRNNKFQEIHDKETVPAEDN